MSRALQILTVLAAVVAALVYACRASPEVASSEEPVMKIQVNQLGIAFAVTHPRIKRSSDLEVRVVFSNESAHSLRLNALFLDFATIVLQVRRPDGTLVNPGPPPLPPIDDGVTGRIDLAPGQSVKFVYRGGDYFGRPLPPGEYQVRFRYENVVSEYADWKGSVETEWVGFEVLLPGADTEDHLAESGPGV